MAITPDLSTYAPERWPAFLTVAEVAKVLRISKSAAYDMVEAGSIPVVRFGGRTYRVPRAALARLAGEQLVGATADPAADQRESEGGGSHHHAACSQPVVATGLVAR